MKFVMHFSANRKFAIVLLLGLMSVKFSVGEHIEDTDTFFSRFLADLWLEGADAVNIIWRVCTKELIGIMNHKDHYPTFIKCIKRKTLRALDRSLSLDVVPIAEGIDLVKFEMVDHFGNTLSMNESSTIWSENDLNNLDWRTLALQRIARVLRTHVIKFDFEDNKNVEKVEERGRRRHHMMTMMMFGIVSIGMVLVPMGFQFLAVLGGKALLLAKMALILASIQGLKKVDTIYDGFHDRGKIASSPLSYGFYHTYPPYEHFDKRSHEGNPLAAPLATKLSWSKINGQQKIDGIKNPSTNRIANQKLPQISYNYEPRQYPIYNNEPDSNTFIDTPLIDKTSRPGEVQADISLELPFNRFHFQSSPAVFST